MSNSSTSNDEIDLKYTYQQFKKVLHGIVRLLFNALDFIISKWYIVLGLLVAGVVLGYFADADDTLNKEAKVLVQANFESGEALYNAVEVLNLKLEEGDESFLKGLGFNLNKPEVTEVEIEPIINIKNIADDLNGRERSLDPLLKYIEFKLDEGELFETFNAKYKYHLLTFSLSHEGDNNDIETVFEYINNTPNLLEIAKIEYQGTIEKFEANNQIIAQIDLFLNKYLDKQQNGAISGSDYYVESDERPDLLVESKNNLLKENRRLKELAVFEEQSVVPISGMQVYPVEKRYRETGILVYPIALVLAFLALAYLRHLYFYLRRIANA